MRISDWSSDVCSSDLLQDTRIEPDLDDLLWNLVNIFHRAGSHADRKLDDNEQLQRRLQREQDGSEIRSVELERAIREGLSLIERRDAMEFFREAATDQYRALLRNAWMRSEEHTSELQSLMRISYAVF